MSIDESLNDYRAALKLLQRIISNKVKSKGEILQELAEDLKE